VVTDGRQGVKVSNGKYLWQAGIFKEKKVIDRTGAGDAFGSALVAAFLKSKKITPQLIERGIRLGSANAASVVEQLGAKAGILCKTGLNQNRWQRLMIKKSDLNG